MRNMRRMRTMTRIEMNAIGGDSKLMGCTNWESSGACGSEAGEAEAVQAALQFDPTAVLPGRLHRPTTTGSLETETARMRQPQM